MVRLLTIPTTLAIAMNLSIAGFAGAATITFNNQAAFAAATSGITFTTVDFEGLAPDDDTVFVPTPPGLTSMGANFTIDHSGGNDGFLFVIGDNFYYPANSVLSSQQSDPVANNILITFPSPVNALSLDAGTLGAAASWSFALSNGDTGVLTAGAFDTLSFFGLISTAPFNTILLTGPVPGVDGNTAAMNIDNVSFGAGTAAEVPEPASMVLVGSTLAIAGLRRRRARRQGAA
jgi:PEP-CTERM motif-containing protein